MFLEYNSTSIPKVKSKGGMVVLMVIVGLPLTVPDMVPGIVTPVIEVVAKFMIGIS